MSKQQIIQLVRQYLQPLQASLGTEIVEQAVHRDGNWWYVPVRSAQQQPRVYGYYEELMAVEGELKEHENIDVLLVPSG